ncbi:hypothetical protein V1515DRAFT_583226 [Lipomyces mesembrius]
MDRPCTVLNVVIQCGDQSGFVPEGDEVVDLGRTRKINWEGLDDITFDREYRLFFWMRLWAQEKRMRYSLARYLSKELGLKCYLDKDFWDQIVAVIDECVFVQYHFLAGTITTTLPEVLAAFTKIVTESPRVIAMQHRIPETSIAFYMDCMGLTAGDPSIVKRKVNSPVVLHPMHVLTSRNGCRTLMAHLLSCYVRWFNPAENRVDMPIVVFTSRASHAALLVSMLRKEAKDRFGDEAMGRIKGILAGVQDNDWVKEFLTLPNSKVEEVDVLITTSVLQAGHSLDRYFKISFDFLFEGVLFFREQLQFTSRLQYIGRDDMAEYKFGWIPSGRADLRVASQRRIRLDPEQAWDAQATAQRSQSFTNRVKRIYVPMR